MVRSVTMSGPADAAVTVATTPLRNGRRRILVLPGGVCPRGFLAREWSRFYRRRLQCRTSRPWFGHNPVVNFEPASERLIGRRLLRQGAPQRPTGARGCAAAPPAPWR